MPRFSVCLLSAFLLTASLHAVQAQDTKDADLRCMAVMAKLNQLNDPNDQFASLIGGYYYLGRLQALAPDMKLGPSARAAFDKMSPAEFLSESERCKQEMRANGYAIREVGAAMPKPPPASK